MRDLRRVLYLFLVIILLIAFNSLVGGLFIDEARSQDGPPYTCYTPKNSCSAHVNAFGALCWCGGSSVGQQLASQSQGMHGRAGPSNNPVLKDLLTTVSGLDLSKFSFEYFRKSADDNKVIDTLNDIGVKVTIKEPVNNLASNTVIISSDVPPELGRFIALALLYKSVSVRGIVYYGINDPALRGLVLAQGALANRIRLVQIGAGVAGEDARPLTEDEVLSQPLPLARKGTPN